MVPGAEVVLLDDPKADEWSVGRLVRVEWELETAQAIFNNRRRYAELTVTGQVKRMRPVNMSRVEDLLRDHPCASEAPSFEHAVSPYEVHLCDLDPASEDDKDSFLLTDEDLVSLADKGLRFYLTYNVDDARMHSSCKQPTPPVQGEEGRPECIDAPFMDKSCLQPGQYRFHDMFYARANYRCGVGKDGEAQNMWADANRYHSLCQKDDAVSAVDGSSGSDSCFGAMSGGSVERCHKGPPPPNSTLLWIGDSHLRQLFEAQMIYNMEHIESVEYVKQSDVPVDSTHTFANLSSSCQADFWSQRLHCWTDISQIVWKNGAVWSGSFNSDFNINLMRGMPDARGVQGILDMFSLGSGASLDAIILNSGNLAYAHHPVLEGVVNIERFKTATNEGMFLVCLYVCMCVCSVCWLM
jgi:hypothetical protein